MVGHPASASEAHCSSPCDLPGPRLPPGSTSVSTAPWERQREGGILQRRFRCVSVLEKLPAGGEAGTSLRKASLGHERPGGTEQTCESSAQITRPRTPRSWQAGPATRRNSNSSESSPRPPCRGGLRILSPATERVEDLPSYCFSLNPQEAPNVTNPLQIP